MKHLTVKIFTPVTYVIQDKTEIMRMNTQKCRSTLPYPADGFLKISGYAADDTILFAINKANGWKKYQQQTQLYKVENTVQPRFETVM